MKNNLESPLLQSIQVVNFNIQQYYQKLSKILCKRVYAKAIPHSSKKTVLSLDPRVYGFFVSSFSHPNYTTRYTDVIHLMLSSIGTFDINVLCFMGDEMNVFILPSENSRKKHSLKRQQYQNLMKNFFGE